jgi:UDP-2,4-diacetamido-2,4,6-trideoxy-beta-L-altropyranose hydrolase
MMFANVLQNGHGCGTVVFRVDSSAAIGTGHLMRCLTLADELMRRGFRSLFVCRPFDGDLRAEISRRGHDLFSLAPVKCLEMQPCESLYAKWLGTTWQDDAADTLRAIAVSGITPDWLVVDHYSLDIGWERILRPHVGRVMVIDDLANRSHDCDLLLDQNLFDRMNDRYSALVPADCRQLLGPQHALLRDEFRRVRAILKPRSGAIHRLLVFFGGVDHANLTMRTLQALVNLSDLSLAVDVVIGGANMHRHSLEQFARQLSNTTVHVQSTDMAGLMGSADLSIGAGGTTTWERAHLGLPSIVVVVADNQREITDAAARAGICRSLGWYEEVSAETITSAMREACGNPQLMRKMSRQALGISAADHETGTITVANALMEGSRVFA